MDPMNKLLRVLPALLLLLGSWEGRVALLNSGTGQPLRVYPYRLSSLPPADQQALATGIPVPNEQELARMLEDYLS